MSTIGVVHKPVVKLFKHENIGFPTQHAMPVSSVQVVYPSRSVRSHSSPSHSRHRTDCQHLKIDKSKSFKYDLRVNCIIYL